MCNMQIKGNLQSAQHQLHSMSSVDENSACLSLTVQSFRVLFFTMGSPPVPLDSGLEVLLVASDAG